ncbi:4Fe-4S dicluster domain-containing protein [Yersinia enterocolitica]
MDKSTRFYHEYLTHRQVSRRGLLRGLINGSRKTFTPTSVLSPQRPPGALPEALFIHCCDGCRRCVDGCVPGVLLFADDGYPVLQIEYAPCSACGICTAACPTGALQPQAHFATGLRPVVDAAQCINPRTVCELCRTACPSLAITISPSDALPTVQLATCNGCGECFIQCEPRAITLTQVN